MSSCYTHNWGCSLEKCLAASLGVAGTPVLVSYTILWIMDWYVFSVAEAFVVCEDYCPPEGYVPTMANPLLDHKYGML